MKKVLKFEKKVFELGNIDFVKSIENCCNDVNKIEDIILNQIDNNYKLLEFIKKHVDIQYNKNILLSTSTIFNVEAIQKDELKSIINCKKINDSRYINKFFESINHKLPIFRSIIKCK